MSDPTIRELEDRIAEIRRRIPPHSVKPAMLEELDELEQQLEALKQAEPEV
jgi:hypothetical protein